MNYSYQDSAHFGKHPYPSQSYGHQQRSGEATNNWGQRHSQGMRECKGPNYESQHSQRDRKMRHYRDQGNSGKIELLKLSKNSFSQNQYDSQFSQENSTMQLPSHSAVYQASCYSGYATQRPQYPFQQTQNTLLQTSDMQGLNTAGTPYMYTPHVLQYIPPHVQILQDSSRKLETSATEFKPSKIFAFGTEPETPGVDYTPSVSSDQPRDSCFSTPKPEPQSHCQHQPSLSCLRNCAQWSLAIKMGSKKAIKVNQSGIAMRQNGNVFSGSQQFQQDIIDTLIQQETLSQCSSYPVDSKDDYYARSMNLENLNGFSEKESFTHINLPFENQETNLYHECVEILKTHLCETMMCVEFDISELPIDSPSQNNEEGEGNIRNINQSLVESTVHFFINGVCHGKRILVQDLHFQLQGKKIIKSIQQRIIDYKQYLADQIKIKAQQLYGGGKRRCRCRYQNCISCKIGQQQQLFEYQTPEQQENGVNLRQLSHILKDLNTKGHGPYLRRSSTLHAKMVNISKSVAFEVEYANLPSIENFLTNFNRLVLQEGVVKKLFFCFDLPLSKFMPNQVQIAQLPIRDTSSLSSTIYETKVLSTLQESTASSEPKMLNLLEEYHKIKVPAQPEKKEQREELKAIDKTKAAQTNFIRVAGQNFVPNSKQPIQQQKQQSYQYQPQAPIPVNLYQYIPPFLASMSQQHFEQNTQLINQLAYQQQMLAPPQMVVQTQRFRVSSNLDSIIDAVTPFANYQGNLSEFFSQFKDSSFNGTRVQLTELPYTANSLGESMIHLVPTLSSLCLKYCEREDVEIAHFDILSDSESIDVGQPQPKLLDFDSFNPQSSTESFSDDANDSQSMSFMDNFKMTRSFGGFQFPKWKIFEHHESIPIYNREPLSVQIENFLMTCDGKLGRLRPCKEIDLESSWFSVVWSSIKQCAMMKLNSQSCQSRQLTLGQQFLVIYKFSSTSSNPEKVEVAGVIALKEEDMDLLAELSVLCREIIFQQTSYQANSQRLQQIQRNKERMIELQSSAIQFLESRDKKIYDHSVFTHIPLPFFDSFSN